jgi:Zn-dependent oligopeptidase
LLGSLIREKNITLVIVEHVFNFVYVHHLVTVHWMLEITERLYGIRFTEAIVPVWHDDVIYLDVKDAVSGDLDNNLIGGIYLDLYPRADKYKHAAAWPVRGVSTRAGRKPISALVTNFNREGLTHSEVETFFHEFGHVLHGVLSKTEYNQHSGTSVERDFVEAPSQMYEEWASRMESLGLMRNHCATWTAYCPTTGGRRNFRTSEPSMGKRFRKSDTGYSGPEDQLLLRQKSRARLASF